ncbi:hypothetical protein RP726_08625 [Candidatus Methylospira mobilis]|uniref:TRAFAC clade GTPase domain-containing protein n=1 Tax=Candidatus Methylospira mobilis TaxID=1808979 RepID=UPI0028E90C81|nr:hypothetical protein [Candidatus Methylospira mobilis]WNV06455.1 hypothetical protein RP726_08625 [Candidatus Methylospira mobilis]
MPTSTTQARVSWSGSALGLADIANLTPRGRSILVGVLGAHDAGKTTLLTGSYLQLLRGARLAGARFAGSRTLGAWESLAAWMRFDDSARSPCFPPHTPRGTNRVPGLLHLALRSDNDEFRDVLLTDAPGEWFSRWAIQENAANAEGAHWIAQKADAFLVFADSQKLSGGERGVARNDLRQLIERLGNHVTNRPTALVWAKDDHQPSDTICEAIRRALYEQIPHSYETKCSANRPGSLLAALETVINSAWNKPRANAVATPVCSHQPFSAFRGHYANT